MKSSCNAAANAKVENACAASYDQMCGGADGGGGGGMGTECVKLKSECLQCSQDEAKSNCDKIVAMNDEASCKVAYDSDAFSPSGPNCQP
jgi:hypothetical protein